MWKPLTLTLPIVYAAFLIAVVTFQRKLIYLPASVSSLDEALAGDRVRKWPSALEFRGWIGTTAVARQTGAVLEGNRAEAAAGDGGADQPRGEMGNAVGTRAANADGKKGTVIVFHGNAGAAFHRTYYVEALEPLGLRVILAEYPGYGGRAGAPSETALVNDALETIRLAHERHGEPLILWGESLGCGVVSGAVRRTSVPLAGLVLFLPWDSLPAVAQHHYWYLPARWLVRDQYNNIENLRANDAAVAVLLADRDEVVPAVHGERLFNALRTRKKLWRFANASHNTVPVDPTLGWWREVIGFLMPHLADPSPSAR
jgi:alpha-beta hydrolase superfamily lysophospholipase